MLKRISRDQVQLGMFIQGFEGSWFRHPFWRTRFVLTDPADLEKLRDSDVPGVIIDTARGLDVAAQPAGSPLSAPPLSAPHLSSPRLPAALPRAPARPRPAPPRDRDLSETLRERDRAEAMRVVAQSRKVMKSVFDGVRLGKEVRTIDVLAVIDSISQSLWRNSRALLGVTRLKSKDEYTYLHSVAVCALMINLARQLDLDEATVQELGIAGLLHDVGKMTVPTPILNKPERLSDAEFILVREHPEKGHAILAGGNDIPAVALDVCLHHHEHMDGSGYPHGLAGPALSLAARMGAICDVYDALTSNRAYKDAWTPVEAIAAMASWDGHFDQPLLFKFMQSISVFPPGMLVRLRSNQLAVVLPNGRRATRPRVKAFYAIAEGQMIAPRECVITDSLAHDQIVSCEDPAHWNLADWPALRDRLVGTMPPLAA